MNDHLRQLLKKTPYLSIESVRRNNVFHLPVSCSFCVLHPVFDRLCRLSCFAKIKRFHFASKVFFDSGSEFIIDDVSLLEVDFIFYVMVNPAAYSNE